VRERISRGEWVIDLRSREVYSRGHLRGTLSFDLDGSFIAYVGWLIPWGTPLTLLGENTEQVEAAQRELVRIGIDRPVAQAVGGPEYWSTDEAEPSSVERVTFEGLAARHAADPDIYVLDVRQQLEWDEGHTAGAHHIPFYRVMDRLHEIPRDRPVYVACGSGYRAAAVVSLLRQQAAVHRWDGTIDGFDNLVHVDDDWANASRTSLPIEAASSQEREPGWTWSESRATARSAATWLAA
jgi:rhodanese-related sulfurtransferase